jgi:hypothetical protein
MKLSPDNKLLICNLIAQYKKPKQIQLLLDEEYGLKVRLNRIREFNDKEQQLISNLRERFLTTISEVPIAQKRVRLDREEQLYEVAGQIKETKDQIDTKLKCLASAREEVEGRGTQSVTFAQYNQYNQLSDTELQDKLKEIELKIAKQNAIEVTNAL